MKSKADALSADVIERGVLRHPADHFDGKFEIKLKYRVSNHEAVLEKLLKLGAEAFRLDSAETDIYMDLPDKSLERQRKTLILRDIQPANHVLWICKGPETEAVMAAELTDIGRACDIAAFLGYVEVLRIQKRRDMYFLDDMHITLDRLDDLGCFVEVATTTNYAKQRRALRKKVKETATSLGLKAGECVLQSYRRLMSEKSAQ